MGRRRSCLIVLVAALVSAEPMLGADPLLSTVAILQISLDREGFGVGLIDNRDGPRTRAALADFCRARGLASDVARRALLQSGTPPLYQYQVTAADLALVGSGPTDWLAASQVPSMAYESIPEALSERFHVAQRYLCDGLNPDINAWDSSLVGTPILVPNVPAEVHLSPAAAVEVNCAEFRLRLYNAQGGLMASFPCSIAKSFSRVPAGELRIVEFAPDPNYTFDPRNFPESGLEKKLLIPPGPNNPVGVYWMSLSHPGFGIHGTRSPETIGRQESRGCFRLTNWDVRTVARAVTATIPVRILVPGASPAEAVAPVPAEPQVP